MPTNLCGNPSNFTEIKRICADNKLLLLEDNCESTGAKWNNRSTGTLGFAGSHSLNHFETIEGGMICTNDRKVHEIANASSPKREIPNDPNVN